MRLLDTETGQFVEKDPNTTEYAILSHTWDTEKGEQTYKELKRIQRRYGPRSRAPQSGTLSSPEQVLIRDGPTPTPPPSQLPRNPSVKTVTPTSSNLQTQTIVHASVCTPVDAPSANNPSAPSSNDPAVLSSNDPPASSSDDPPALASSHTSTAEHQSKMFHHSIWDDTELSPKIREACAVARAHHYRYIWIDSCCIDKSSSSELSEAINSMYTWYATAVVCYAYLADVPPGDDHQAQGSHFRKSRWFTRGWTLQELIAPMNVVFLSKDWTSVGSKHALVDLVENITDIDFKALLNWEPLDAFSVAQRLSWAANRKTTRNEDIAYSLLGIFDIHMPTLYGEGDRAFRRLQEQIIQRIPDRSLFAWGEVYLGSQLPPNPDLTDTSTIPRAYAVPRDPHRSPFAASPDDFKSTQNTLPYDAIHCRRFPASHHHKLEYTSTPYGTRTQFQMMALTQDFPLGAILPSEVVLDLPEECRWYLALLGCEHVKRPGHLLGRVCFIPPSESGIEFICVGSIRVPQRQDDDLSRGWCSLFPLSLETIEHCRPLTELKTVYMSHPGRANPPSRLITNLQTQPYSAIKLVLLRETSDALRSRGYSAELRGYPDPNHPISTTHRLTLSNDEHTITVEFQHTLAQGGKQFTLTAEVIIPGSRALSFESGTGDSHQAESHTASWTDRIPWHSRAIKDKTVRLSAAGAGTPLTVVIGLDCAIGTGVYFLHVDVLIDTPPAADSGSVGG